MISSQLPVQRDVVLGVVGDADDDAVAFPGDELGAGELPVHRDDVVRVAQPLHRRLLDLDDDDHKPQASKQTRIIRRSDASDNAH